MSYPSPYYSPNEQQNYPPFQPLPQEIHNVSSYYPPQVYPSVNLGSYSNNTLNEDNDNILSNQDFFKRDPFLYKSYITADDDDPNLEYLGIGRIQLINLKGDLKDAKLAVQQGDFLNLSMDELLALISEQISTDPSQFREFSSLLYHYLQAEKSEKSKDEHLYSTIFNPTTTNAQVENTIMKIKENMESHQQIAVDHSTILPQIERKFLNSLINSMQKSGFVVLKHIELKLLTDIVKESSLYTNHVVIEWEKLNATLLSSYYDKLMLSSHLYDWDVPEYARRCLIFWRGVSMEKEVGFFHLQKLNLLLTKIFKDSGLEKFVKKFHLLREMDTKTMGESFQLRNNPRISLQMNELHLIEKQSSFVFPKVVSMKHLAVRNYSLLSLLKSFFKKEEIIEPSFDEIILVFRLDKSNKNIQNENANSIFVHRFFDVKFRDFPAIFPTKKTTRNIVDLLYFLLMAISIVSLIISISTVWAQSTYFDEALLTILFLLSPLVIRYICQLIFSFRSHRTQQKLSYNYAKHSLNCNKSVLSYIKSESIQHESVSLILIYFFLLESDGPLDIENLEGLCRQFLSENFNIPLGYKVEEGIFRLQKLGLVEIVDHKLYMAKSLEFSIKQLETLLLASARKVY